MFSGKNFDQKLIFLKFKVDFYQTNAVKSHFFVVATFFYNFVNFYVNFYRNTRQKYRITIFYVGLNFFLNFFSHFWSLRLIFCKICFCDSKGAVDGIFCHKHR